MPRVSDGYESPDPNATAGIEDEDEDEGRRRKSQGGTDRKLLDALVAKQACSLNGIQSGKDILLRIVSMLSKWVAKFETTATPETVLGEELARYSG